MLDKIIKYSIKNKLIIGLLTLALIGWGSYSLTKLPIDAVPDITDNQVMVITVSPTLAAQEVERLVTFPVEQTMVSIPEIKEMRSFSRFGLSIVTIVFKESTDLYWARQQVQERLSLAGNEIPDGVGQPEMAPVTTGLGEIYQYVVKAKPGYEDQYDATELRTIQDWLIKRQLLGTEGVAEVSGFGGYVKQYEIAIDPDKIRSFNISINEVFDALKANNQNTGGAYIDKNPNAYFIRSEGLIKSIEEIEKIVIRSNINGNPLLVRDVATVQFGHGVRYGAATQNAQGETVTGIVMMLKGANSSAVINNVKEKIEQIKTNLPEGVTIEPFLDRKSLVDRAIGTVTTNLVEGALIVIFILILFLGNLRGGLIVASVIPLAMLFAIGMMRLFGVSGNLMSLGAIDFGLIVDGAVIIVEAVLHGIHVAKKKYAGVKRLTAAQMDHEVFESASKIRTSAAFGEIIILIVYLPLWALVGVEGKMFTPMAQTVSFAILGAFLLSLTYVPMLSALALSKKTTHKRNFSDKMMDGIQKAYRPIIKAAIRMKSAVALSAVALFVIALFVFNGLGGEFIPQLDEGDFAVETRVPVGSSLQQSIEVSQKAQEIILREFPEVKQVVNKIGSGEIPTDPMPIEAGDMMIILKPKNEWVSASTREELVSKMEEALAVIPNATFGFQQPIQMRFNELLTGAKQDVVLKIYGEDLNTLASLAKEVGSLIQSVPGAEDLYIEEITGLPQIQIELNRDKIAMYGMNVQDINQAIAIAFAGQSSGLVYEGEKRFDMVVRLDKTYRTDISDVQNLFVENPNGAPIPLHEVASVTYAPGPVQIQRDNAKRRVTIGFNVRTRDVKSVVADIQQIVKTKMDMPAGYYVTYGGQFENLQRATQRLAIVVPLALLLIFVLLYFTFGSIKQGLLIFTAIPLSAIGGVFALLLRDMPFSISAGVGFIALFGVAVLNGIVLIAEFNRLEKEGVTDIYQRVLKGTKLRLRPVLMTAAVASLGFLPMAISTTAGAEVQRPLATVVIGGLLTATLLTLVVLPVLYILLNENKPWSFKKVKTLPMVILLVVFCSGLNSQAQSQGPKRLSLQEAIDYAKQRNEQMRLAKLVVEDAIAKKNGVWAIPRLEVNYMQGVVSNPTIEDNMVNVIQRIEFPTVYVQKVRVAKAQVVESEQASKRVEQNLVQQVKMAYLRYVFVLEQINLLKQQDSLYSSLSSFSKQRFETGESARLEMVAAKTQAMQAKNKLMQVQAELRIAQTELQVLLQTEEAVVPTEKQLKKLLLPANMFDTLGLQNNPELAYLQQAIAVSEQKVKLAKHQWFPDLMLGYNSQTYNGQQTIDGQDYNFTKSDRFSFFQVGLAIPLLPSGQASKVKSANIKVQIAKSNMQLVKNQLNGEFLSLQEQYRRLQQTLAYYESEANPQADLIIANSEASFKNGETSYSQHFINLNLALSIRQEYVQSTWEYNQVVIAIERLLGNF
ncbi:MAG: CusA/CzcA family heavy metal efflux RND transporter [Roseivirga sp.]|uniref:CusA/CzcA family heavy metal efflux RND transporter n=1 Tax=Roseivirga sp. TaxID=1964215 RepID=UPI001B193518|nr:CusA/CzcA family heavy metal efflux RND transporter [Roseivirga sp.]MBO6660375.1 CusA/CzcA family heavy metal efflux RND transporter [Roseivirga sp.]MBO6906888.1 CusA/CzcA family heavy metal efflux RND transporter [Roseivirga sp.]